MEYHITPKNKVAFYVLTQICVQYIKWQGKHIHRTVFIAWGHSYKKEIYVGMIGVYKIIAKCQKTCNLMYLSLEKGIGLKEGEKGTSLFYDMFRISI